MNSIHRNLALLLFKIKTNKLFPFHFLIVAIIILSTAVMQSCQDVIHLDLPNAAPQIVIVGSISNFVDSVKVSITMTTDYFTPTAITPVTNAQVSISDDAGNVYQLAGEPDGTYFITNFAGIPERTYTLKVIANGNQYIATSKMPGLVPLDSLAVEYDTNRRGKNLPGAILCFLKDPAGIANFYRVKVFKNDTLFSPSNGYSVYNDKYFDGKSTDIRVGLGRLKMTTLYPNDKIVVQLMGIDQQTYVYFNVFRDVLDQSGILSASTPANPPNNLNNGALGYFAAWSISQRMMIFK